MRYEFILENKELLLLSTAVALTVLSVAVGYMANSGFAYFALTLFGVGGGCLYALFIGVKGQALGLLLAFLSSVVAVGYFPLYLALSLRKRRMEKRKMRIEEKRQLCFTLPDKDNAFLRDRLRLSLRDEALSGEGVLARLHYAKGMLVKLKGKSLSPTEKMDIEEMSAFIALLSKKGRWTVAEQKGINETLARLLKLAAKHEIEL